MEQFYDYLIDIIDILIVLAICFVMHKLYFVLVIKTYAKRILIAIDNKEYKVANKMLSIALKKQPGRKIFLDIEKTYKKEIEN